MAVAVQSARSKSNYIRITPFRNVFRAQASLVVAFAFKNPLLESDFHRFAAPLLQPFPAPAPIHLLGHLRRLRRPISHSHFHRARKPHSIYSPPMRALNATPTPHFALFAVIAISPAHFVPCALVSPELYRGVGSLEFLSTVLKLAIGSYDCTKTPFEAKLPEDASAG